MRVSLDTVLFEKQMDNLVNYSLGFIDGVHSGKTLFLNNLGKGTILALESYIDVNAKMNQRALHHVYEWYQTGSPQARLFDLNYTVSNLGLSIKSTFRQSRTMSQDSKVPFYNKAKIMEDGIPVTIKPKSSGVLVFKNAGETIFTKKEITIKDPGGTQVAGSFEQIVDEFIRQYFKQSFLKASGIYDYISKPKLYKENVAAGIKGGRTKGIETGFKWIANAKIGVE
jgi:hypothetical protein